MVQLSGASFSVQRAALSGPCLCPQFEALLLGSRSLCCQACLQSPPLPQQSWSAAEAAGPLHFSADPAVNLFLTACFPPSQVPWWVKALLVFCLVSCPTPLLVSWVPLSGRFACWFWDLPYPQSPVLSGLRGGRDLEEAPVHSWVHLGLGLHAGFPPQPH